MTAAFVDRVRSRLAATDLDRDLSQVAREESQLLTDAVVLSELSAELSAELRGAGPLEPLLALAGVTDVLVNAPDQVWIDRGSGLERASVRFADDAAIRRLAVRLAGQAHHRLDDAAPWVDAVLNDGTRLHRCCRRWSDIRRFRCGCSVDASSVCPISSIEPRCPSRSPSFLRAAWPPG